MRRSGAPHVYHVRGNQGHRGRLRASFKSNNRITAVDCVGSTAELRYSVSVETCCT
jgi:hypothetical protein